MGRLGTCTVFHAAQRASLEMRGGDARQYKKQQTQMSIYFVHTASAFGNILNYPTYKDDAIAHYNKNFEDSRKTWLSVMAKAGIEGSPEQKTYNKFVDGCAMVAEDYDSMWQKAKRQTDDAAIEAEIELRLKALGKTRGIE